MQGDRPCGSTALRVWSGNITLTDQRIDTALITYLGDAPLEGILLFGSSQGVKLATALVRRYPKKYTRLVMLGVFEESTSVGVEALEAAHFLVGEKENPGRSGSRRGAGAQ